MFRTKEPGALLPPFAVFVAYVVLMIGPVFVQRAAAQEDSAKSASAEVLTETRIIERVTGAVDRAMEYLADQQGPDGAWDGNHAPNALALLAFMGRGHVPGRGPYRELLEKGKNYILRSQDEDGLFVPNRRVGSGPMYQQGLATLALAEMYGMDPDPRLEECLRKAVDLTVRSQSESGGWRYHPRPRDADVSVTVMQIVALRAANNAEIPVPQETITRAVEYVKSCAHPDGGFGYQRPEQRPPTTAAGVVSLQLLGHYDDPTIAKALDFMATIPAEWGKGPQNVRYFYYYHYYAIQASYQAGGRYWSEWHPQVREMFLERQNPDGSWDMPPGTSERGRLVGENKVYWTSMASLVLEVYMHFLPAYQR